MLFPGPWIPNRILTNFTAKLDGKLIYGRGLKEILRHHATERHLRKDQRWRYEHSVIEDPVTHVVRHYVRGKDMKLLTPLELEVEVPNFIDVELIDIGEKMLFYDELMSVNNYMASSSENRVRVQISILELQPTTRQVSLVLIVNIKCTWSKICLVFQVMFHHIFVQLLEDVTNYVLQNKKDCNNF